MSDTNLVCKKGYQQSSLNELVITFLKSIYKNGYQQSSLNKLVISFLWIDLQFDSAKVARYQQSSLNELIISNLCFDLQFNYTNIPLRLFLEQFGSCSVQYHC